MHYIINFNCIFFNSYGWNNFHCATALWALLFGTAMLPTIHSLFHVLFQFIVLASVTIFPFHLRAWSRHRSGTGPAQNINISDWLLINQPAQSDVTIRQNTSLASVTVKTIAKRSMIWNCSCYTICVFMFQCKVDVC